MRIFFHNCHTIPLCCASCMVYIYWPCSLLFHPPPSQSNVGQILLKDLFSCLYKTKSEFTLHVSYINAHSSVKKLHCSVKILFNDVNKLFMSLLFEYSFLNTYSLCCLLPAPPIPLFYFCISLYITICHSYSPDHSPPFTFPSFQCNPILCPLCALCHHSSQQYVLNYF